MPLTTITVTRDPATGQELFVARTAIGPLGFDDAMVVAFAEPPTGTSPGIARLVKTGPVIRGWSAITVTPLTEGSEVRWYEEARLRGTGGPVVALASRAWAPVAARLLDGLLA